MSNEELDNLDPSFYAIWNLRDALEKMIEKHPCQNTVDPSRCTVPPGGAPASTHGSMRSKGKVAKCAPLKGFGVTVQTERLLRVARGSIL